MLIIYCRCVWASRRWRFDHMFRVSVIYHPPISHKLLAFELPWVRHPISLPLLPVFSICADRVSMHSSLRNAGVVDSNNIWTRTFLVMFSAFRKVIGKKICMRTVPFDFKLENGKHLLKVPLLSFYFCCDPLSVPLALRRYRWMYFPEIKILGFLASNVLFALSLNREENQFPTANLLKSVL